MSKRQGDQRKHSFLEKKILHKRENGFTMLYMTRMTQNKNDPINSILQHGRVVDNNFCVVFPVSKSPYLILCPS